MRPAPSLALLAAATLALIAQTADQRLRADLAFLTSDPLAGRLSLTPQADVAAHYIAAAFQAAGLEPANGDSYLQPFPVVGYRVDPQARKLAFTRSGGTRQWHGGSDFTGA